MAVNPIDLQVIFTQLNQISKQQSDTKDIEILRQDQASQQINKEGEKNAEDVPEAKKLDEAPGKIKDKEKNRKNKQNENKKEDKNQDNNIEDELNDNKKNNADKKFKDPNLGQKIDIIG